MGLHCALTVILRKVTNLSLKLRKWQAEAIKKAVDWYETGEQLFLTDAAPGAGKTIFASALAKQLLAAGKIERVIAIAPRKQVTSQWGDEFKIVTGRPMMRVLSSENGVDGYGLDLCLTWQSVDGLLPSLQAICQNFKTMVICDEHHHAAVSKNWGDNAEVAFKDASCLLVLSGTPVRADGLEPIWFEYNKHGGLNQPESGKYTLTYGEAVDLGYCRPITFHRHEGLFNVVLKDGDRISVSGKSGPQIPKELKKIRGLTQALDFYRLACTPMYMPDGVTPDLTSYQSTMIEWGISKLDDLRLSMPNAGGLVIAPNIEVAEYIADILELFEGERPSIVHNQVKNPEAKISAFRESKKKWLVSVSMVSEGVDIKRLRVLVYLPNARTELSFRQAMGRVVRSTGNDDISRAYVIMPVHPIFELYAKRVEREMGPAHTMEEGVSVKTCPVCEEQVARDAKLCGSCGYQWPEQAPKLKPCHVCDGLNPLTAKECLHCGASLGLEFDLGLNDALRVGAIVRGMEIDETDVKEAEELRDNVRNRILRSGDEKLIYIVKQLPEESWASLKQILNS